MKKIKDILEVLQTIVSIGFYVVAAYAVYYMVFVKQLWMVAVE